MVKVKTDAMGMLKLASTVNNVTDMLENPINDPIERSNSPLIIKSVTPIARIPISDETWR